MARAFNEAGIAALAVWGDSHHDKRRAALADLATGRVRVVFSVDLLNEGVDVPVVDTLLLLRPTDSPVLFLQQLGRGLQRAPGKTVCTVLDFVGHHRKEFRFDRRFGALMGGTRKNLTRQVEEGFPFLPAGCHMELDPVASDIVLRSIRESVPSRWTAKIDELRTFVAEGREVTLRSFLHESGDDLGDVYTGQRGWSDLCEAAGVPVEPALSIPGPGGRAGVLRTAAPPEPQQPVRRGRGRTSREGACASREPFGGSAAADSTNAWWTTLCCAGRIPGTHPLAGCNGRRWRAFG